MAIEMPKWYGVFHHPLTIHGSYKNDSDKPKRVFIINTFIDGAGSNRYEPALNGANVIPKGEKMEGQFYPLLFESGKI